jgi:hypothetical protein
MQENKIMKTNSKWMLLAAALAVSGASAFFVHVSSAAPAATPPGTHERVELKVLKVFSAEDDGAVFRAYLVEWNGQEVVVEDTLAKTHYHTDAMIPVLVMKHPYPKGQQPYGLLHFSVL